MRRMGTRTPFLVGDATTIATLRAFRIKSPKAMCAIEIDEATVTLFGRAAVDSETIVDTILNPGWRIS